MLCQTYHMQNIPRYTNTTSFRVLLYVAADPACRSCFPCPVQPYVSIAFQEADGAAARLVEGILRRKSFYFQQRTGKLDMRAIGRVDVDKVIKDVDIDTLQVSAMFLL